MLGRVRCDHRRPPARTLVRRPRSTRRRSSSPSRLSFGQSQSAVSLPGRSCGGERAIDAATRSTGDQWSVELVSERSERGTVFSHEVESRIEYPSFSTSSRSTPRSSRRERSRSRADEPGCVSAWCLAGQRRASRPGGRRRPPPVLHGCAPAMATPARSTRPGRRLPRARRGGWRVSSRTPSRSTRTPSRKQTARSRRCGVVRQRRSTMQVVTKQDRSWTCTSATGPPVEPAGPIAECRP